MIENQIIIEITFVYVNLRLKDHLEMEFTAC